MRRERERERDRESCVFPSLSVRAQREFFDKNERRGLWRNLTAFMVSFAGGSERKRNCRLAGRDR